MESMSCPYCGQENHSSCPEIMSQCAYCGGRFAQASSKPSEKLVILDRGLEESEETAAELTSLWQEKGEVDKKAIVDRRHGFDLYLGPERRRYANTERPRQALLSVKA